MFVLSGMENVDIIFYEGGRHEILNEINREEVYEDLYRGLLYTSLFFEKLYGVDDRRNDYGTNQKKFSRNVELQN